MKEIKFRQWCNRDKKFHYWGFLQGSSEFFESPLGYMSEDNPRESQQFTGLFDKNGKEIYEGDISNIIFRTELGVAIDRNCVMKWLDKSARFAFEFNAELIFDVEDDTVISVEVIGNIYEHKHLLDNND